MPECPACGEELKPADMNLTEGVALCPSCGELTRLRELAQDDPAPDAPDRAPPGCVERSDGLTTVLQASCRSVPAAAGALAIAAFWDGITLIFVLIAIGESIRLATGSVPSWFPAPQMSGQGMGPGVVIFLWVFLLPFIGIGLVLLVAAAVACAGRVRVEIERAGARVHTGVGPIGWSQRFDPRAVTKVSLARTSWTENGRRRELIEIRADRRVRFGTILTQERRAWLVSALRRVLLDR